jgi:hypothetical protein
MFYLLILVVLSALWDKVAAEQVALARYRRRLAVHISITEWVALSVVGINCVSKTTYVAAPWRRICCGPSLTCCSA